MSVEHEMYVCGVQKCVCVRSMVCEVCEWNGRGVSVR